MDINFPVELVLRETPISLQASSQSKDAWKTTIGNAAKAQLPEGAFLNSESLSAIIYYFPPATMIGDIDNIVKPILDALNLVIYQDDHQIDRVFVRKFEPDKGIKLTNPSPALLQAAGMEPPAVYIRIDNEMSRGELQWS